jgi:hypothetical protein
MSGHQAVENAALRLQLARMAKNIEHFENMRSSMMDAGQDEQPMGAPFGVYDQLGESGTRSVKRISRRTTF